MNLAMKINPDNDSEKILRVVLLSRFPPDTNKIRNGVQAASAYLLKGLSSINNLDLHILTFRQPGWQGSNHYQYNQSKVHLLPPYPRFERLRDFHTYQRILNQCLEEIHPDIIHVQGASSDALVALRSGYPTVVTAHGIRREEHKYYGSLGERIRCYVDSRLTETRVMRHTRYLIAISQYMIQYFSPLLRKDIQYFFIPNALDEAFFGLNINDPQSKEGTTQNFILYAGRVSPLKRVMDIVQAFGLIQSELPDVHINIAGDHNQETSYANSIRALIHHTGLGERVHLLGELDQEGILQQFSQCSLFVLPSAQENAPMVIAQAMAAGKAVVATRVGGVPEMLGENSERGLLVEPGDVNGLAHAILRLHADTELRSRLGESARQFALANYHQDQVAQRTYEVYQLVAEAERRPRVGHRRPSRRRAGDRRRRGGRGGGPEDPGDLGAPGDPGPALRPRPSE